MESPILLPAQIDKRNPAIVVSGVTVAVNSCPHCRGSRVCRECKGSGDVPRPSSDDPGRHGKCGACKGGGKCWTCWDHSHTLSQFADELERGSLGEAEARLQRGLMATETSDREARSFLSMGGAGVGLVLGSLIAPGLGTIVGLSVGKMLGDKVAEGDDVGLVKWKQADLLYSLGIVYAAHGRKGEASQAWIKALALDENHQAAKTALKESL